MTHNFDRAQMEQSPREFRRRRRQNGSTMNEEEQMDLASTLMELETEEEFENFLGDLLGAAKGFIDSPTGQALGGALKDVAKQILPVAGKALGSYIGGPTGGQIGGALGSAASSAFEAETDEQEWEAANIFVKVAVDSVNNAAAAPPGSNPESVAHNAVIEAARRHAPHVADHLLTGRRDRFHSFRRSDRSGRWARHGNRIVVFGV